MTAGEGVGGGAALEVVGGFEEELEDAFGERMRLAVAGDEAFEAGFRGGVDFAFGRVEAKFFAGAGVAVDDGDGREVTGPGDGAGLAGAHGEGRFDAHRRERDGVGGRVASGEQGDERQHRRGDAPERAVLSRAGAALHRVTLP